MRNSRFHGKLRPIFMTWLSSSMVRSSLTVVLSDLTVKC